MLLDGKASLLFPIEWPMKYNYLLRILDELASEAPDKYTKKYSKNPASPDSLDQRRARSLIHLYLKVNFGLTEFELRERNITDGGYDGGIDSYYIHKDSKTVYLIQSKFRTSEENFESKEISIRELLAMDVDRILDGESADEAGNTYCGKIKQLQRDISELEDVARYRYQIVILANLKTISRSDLTRLFGGLSADVFDSSRTYKELVFPVLTGTYFTASDITIPIDLSNKNAGSKISYTVKTKYADCEITVLFVPAIEIARIMSKYKNSILKYNPRSYLEHEGQSVNDAIRNTVINSTSNELALYNNGITMLSEETYINEKIGQKNKAQLSVKNPQIINGGQTSFTFSRILNESGQQAEQIFANKEILLKVITVIECDAKDKEHLIDEISVATNRQTPVINADKFANDTFHKELQELLFNRYGMLYERKRGEFADGIKDHYIDKNKIIERNSFWRIYYAANGDLDKAIQKKLFQKNRVDTDIFQKLDQLDRWYFGFRCVNSYPERFGKGIKLGNLHYAKLYLYIELASQNIEADLDARFVESLIGLDDYWERFMKDARDQIKANPGRNGGKLLSRNGEFNEMRYIRNPVLIRDVIDFVQKEKP